MSQPACTRLAHLTLRAAAALALVVASCLLAPDGVTRFASAAFADGNGNGSSGNGNGNGNGGNNAGGNSGNSNAGGNNPNAGPGNNSGKGNTNPGGKNSYTNAAGDTLSVDGNKITVLHRNGMKEQVQNGRFQMMDAQGRTIIERQATEEDLNRLLNL